jgi:NAD(P)-dependent dehydrogenase (short-subunit alcohol dehydrogenase family)
MRLGGKVAVITGASRGLGAAVARRFAGEGAHVVLIARSVADLESVDDSIRAQGGAATLVPLDLLDAQGIDRLAAPLHERFGRLDILVGNAAILGRLTPLAHYPPDLWREVFTVNVDANWRLIRTLDPLLRAAPAGRAIFVTSGITRRVAAYWGAYAASKAALESLVITYAAETAASNLRVNLLNPGPARTQMRAAAFPGEDPASLPPPEALTEAFVALAEPGCVMHGQLVSARDLSAQASPVAAAFSAPPPGAAVNERSAP